MAAIVFPYLPAVGDLWPPNPGEGNVSQYRWDGDKWVTVPVFVSLGSENQRAYNSYQWPITIGDPGDQLTNDGSGNLQWSAAAVPSFAVLNVSEPFDGVKITFDLIDAASGAPFTPTPVENIIVFLGAVPQTPNVAYTVSGDRITFTEAPLSGTVFYALSSINLQ